MLNYIENRLVNDKKVKLKLFDPEIAVKGIKIKAVSNIYQFPLLDHIPNKKETEKYKLISKNCLYTFDSMGDNDFTLISDTGKEITIDNKFKIKFKFIYQETSIPNYIVSFLYDLILLDRSLVNSSYYRTDTELDLFRIEKTNPDGFEFRNEKFWSCMNIKDLKNFNSFAKKRFNLSNSYDNMLHFMIIKDSDSDICIKFAKIVKTSNGKKTFKEISKFNYTYFRYSEFEDTFRYLSSLLNYKKKILENGIQLKSICAIREDGIFEAIMNKNYYKFKLNETEKQIFDELDIYGGWSYEDDLRTMVKHYKKYEGETTTSASAPDTSKFIASHYGFISVDENIQSSGGYYGIPKYIRVGIKIGPNFKYGNPRLIGRYIIYANDQVRKCKYNNSESEPCLQEINGSAWSAFGMG